MAPGSLHLVQRRRSLCALVAMFHPAKSVLFTLRLTAMVLSPSQIVNAIPAILEQQEIFVGHVYLACTKVIGEILHAFRARAANTAKDGVKSTIARKLALKARLHIQFLVPKIVRHATWEDPAHTDVPVHPDSSLSIRRGKTTLEITVDHVNRISSKARQRLLCTCWVTVIAAYPVAARLWVLGAAK